MLLLITHNDTLPAHEQRDTTTNRQKLEIVSVCVCVFSPVHTPTCTRPSNSVYLAVSLGLQDDERWMVRQAFWLNKGAGHILLITLILCIRVCVCVCACERGGVCPNYKVSRVIVIWQDLAAWLKLVLCQCLSNDESHTVVPGLYTVIGTSSGWLLTERCNSSTRLPETTRRWLV